MHSKIETFSIIWLLIMTDLFCVMEFYVTINLLDSINLTFSWPFRWFIIDFYNLLDHITSFYLLFYLFFCIIMYSYVVLLGVLMFLKSFCIFLTVLMYDFIWFSVVLCIIMHYYVLLCIIMYSYVLLFGFLCFSIFFCGFVYAFQCSSELFSILQSYSVLFCIIMYYYVLFCMLLSALMLFYKKSEKHWRTDKNE